MNVRWGPALADGIGQIFFQPVVWTGLAVLAAFVVADWRMAVLVVIGTVSSTLTGYLLGVAHKDIQVGQQGFCGALIGAAVFSALGTQWVAYPITIVAAALTAPVSLLVMWIFAHEPFKPLNLPSTTAPFCLLAGLMYTTTFSLHVASTSDIMDQSTISAFGKSILTNVSEVVLLNDVWAGALILLGLFLASWKVGVAAVLGSVVGSLCALALGEDITGVGSGLEGYSGVLTAIALAVVFLKGTWEPWVMAVIGAVMTALVTVWMHHVSGPVYTWPYILTTWALLAVAHVIPRLQRA
ncbi:urea transporter [Sanguibacter gelidistatuariae]|uniref:urea transporter n=1 Tax=Sanguibacter gelidistatuariae TaxID=1814289 RepID=UPI001587FBFA|nr:urea transporter [Sanguibacter gelidistatuariae]